MRGAWASMATLALPEGVSAQDMAMPEMVPMPVFHGARVDLAEMQFGPDGDGYRWEGEGWVGDLDRAVLRTRGEGAIDRGVDHAEAEALWSHAVSPWWNVQVGVRQDFGRGPQRTHATIALEGQAPFRIDVLAAAYVSDQGQWSARIEAAFDQHVTRRIVVQPRAEMVLTAQAMPAQRLGAGLGSAEFGVRLRYEVTRRFAPYLGLSWTWSGAGTAAMRRAEGDPATNRALIAGVRARF